MSYQLTRTRSQRSGALPEHGSKADHAELAVAIASTEMKERLKAEVDAAMARGVFGSPTVIVDGELFFGADRLPQVERWLAEGGF